MDRLVSLAPSATATLVALEAADRLVGVTHHVDPAVLPHPADVEIVGGWLTPDRGALADLDPDLVLTADPLQAELAGELRAAGHRVFHHEPATLEDVIAGFEEVAAAVGVGRAGERLAEECRDRIERCRSSSPDGATRPVVYCEEWPNPPMVAGNWVPDVVEAAGGRYPFRASGARSARIDGAAVAAAAPDLAVVHYCGRGTADPPDLEARWGLEVDVHAVDDSLLNQPSPRLLDGLERLTTLLVDAAPSDRSAAGG